MHKFLLFSLALTVLCLGCQDDTPDKTKLLVNDLDSFIVSSIQKDASGNINAIGYDENSDQNVIYRYDEELHFVEKINLTEQDFKGVLQVKFLADNTCLISQFTEEPTPQLLLNRADSKFNILNRKVLRSSENSLFRATMRDIILLEDGNIGICYDTIAISQRPQLIFGGYEIARLDKELNRIHSYQESFGRYYGHHTPHIVERNDGSIFFITSTNIPEQFAFPYGRISMGTLTTSGEIMNNMVLKLEKEQQWLEPYSLSATDKGVILHFMANSQNLRYLSFDPEDGIILKNVELPYGEINHRNERGAFTNYSPTNPETFVSASANELPKKLKVNQGNILYSSAEQHLYFQQYHEDGSFTKAFTLSLPEFDELYSYRHLFTEKNTMVVAISYRYKGKNFLTLRELTLDGHIVQ